MSKRKLSLLVIITLLCFSVNVKPNDYKLLDKIIVSVEKDVITQTELENEIQKQIKKKDFSTISRKKVEKEVLDTLVEKKLILQFAENSGLTPSREEVDIVLNNLLAQNSIELDTLKLDLLSQGISLEEFKADLKYQLVVQKIKDREIMPYVNVSDYEIDAWIKKNNNLDNTEFKIRHILIKTDNPFKDKILKEIKNINNFPAYAQKYSDGPNAENGGDLGWNKINDLPEIFIPFLKNAKIGDISDGLVSPNGTHFLILEDKKNNYESKTVLIRQYKFQQILLKRNLVSNDDDLRKKLENIKNIIDTELNFSDAVKLYSDDQFNIDKDKLNWVNYENLLPEFRENLNQYPLKKIIGPFKTELGWHLIYIYDFRETDITNETEKKVVKINIARNKTEIRFKDWIESLKSVSKIEYFSED